MTQHKVERSRELKFKTAMLLMAVLLLGSFWLTVRSDAAPVSLAVLPEVPRENEPVIALFKLNNPSSETLVFGYRFYANGRLLEQGTTTIGAHSAKTYKYAYANPLQTGEQLNFVIETESRLGKHEKVLSSPPYPPQVWSSFVSFASFSTSVMSSISTMTYYENSFAIDSRFNVGLILASILVALLIFMELTQPVLERLGLNRMGRLRIRFSVVNWILLIIFLGMVYTRVVMILAS